MKPDAPEINVDGIPNAMTSRDQWVNWKYEWRCSCDDADHSEECSEGEWSKAPYQSSGRNYAKSNDSDTWSTFDEAIEAYEDGRVDGLGFVFDGDLVGFDFDDCRDPDHPHGSVPDLVQEQIKDLESYTELSPSKTGYHTIVKGELPEGYEGNRNDLPCNPVRDDWDTPHLEVYDESSPRYFTVTGDSIHEELDTVPQTVEERQELVEEVHETWIAEEEESPTKAEEGLTLSDEELLEKARNARDSEKFTDLYDGNWEQYGYESHSEARMAFAMKLAFWCQGDTARMTRLFKQSGLIRDQDDVRTFENYEAPKAARRVTEYYEPGERSIDDGPLSENDGVLGYWQQVDDGWEFSRVTNFTMEVTGYLDTDGDTLIDMIVRPATDEGAYNVQVSVDVFTDSRSFRKEVVKGLSTVVETPRGQRTMNDLKRHVGIQDAPRRTGTDVIGIHDDELVTPNGVLTSRGWTDDPDHEFIENTIGNMWALDPGVDVDHEELREILKLLPQTRSSERFLPVLSWFYAAPLRPYIMEWEGQFNHLSIDGTTGSGKTTTIRTLMECFGLTGEPNSVSSTNFTLLGLFSGTNGVPVWFDEYKPADIWDSRLKTFHDLFRKASSNAVDRRGKADQTYETYEISAATVITGEQHLQGAAEQRRAIMTRFQTDDTQPGTETADAFARLTGGRTTDDEVHRGYELAQHAQVFYQWVLGLDESDLKEHWDSAGETVHEKFDLTDLRDLPIQGLQTIVFGYNIFMTFAHHRCGVVEDDLPVDDKVFSAVEYIAGEMRDEDTRKSHLDEFFEVAGRAAIDGYLKEDQHYTFIYKGETKEELAININQSFDKISKYVQDHGLSSLDLFDSPRDYTKRVTEAVESDGDHYITKKTRSDPVGRATRLHVKTAEEQLSGFRRNQFANDEREVSLDEAEEGDTVTAEVKTLEEIDDDTAIVQRGELEDSGGRRRYVVWETASDRLEEGQCYRFRNISTNRYNGWDQVALGIGTRVSEIQQGVGLTQAADSESGSLDSFS